MDASPPPVIEVDHLSIAYTTRQGAVPAVRDVSFAIAPGETLGLVGESGCGKSTVAFGLVSYLGRNGRVTSGDIRFQGQSLLGRSAEDLRRLRGDRIALVCQDPQTSLNPTLRIGDQLTEVLTVHRGLTPAAARTQCLDMLARVYMPDPAQVLERFPHQLSGGQQQRVVIAMALLNRPALLILDEPTTALDVTVEAAVLDLIADLRRDFDTALLFISHNLGVVARVCHRVGVMYAGELVELAPVEQIFSDPRHPYTQGLLRALPKLGRSKTDSALHPIRGRLPAPDQLPPGCVFAPRCDYVADICRQQPPDLRRFSSTHAVRCHFAETIDASAWVPLGDVALPPLSVSSASAQPILQVHDLKAYYPQPNASLLARLGVGRREFVRAVDGVSFDLPRGATLGIVGESGSGKSTLVKALIGLESITGGTAEFLSADLHGPTASRDLALVRELQMVFQNPDATLNPAYTIGRQIERPLRRFKVVPPNQVRAEVIRLLRAVKLDEYYYDRLPRQLSGGEQQRVGIARAFAGRPQLVLCDEPVSALDVSVQAAVLNLLLEIQRERGTTLVLIAHDLSVVRYFSDQVAVMYLGQFVEVGPTDAIYTPPYHPYTESLLAAVPDPDPAARPPIRLTGTVPSALHPPSGCRFHTRCPRRVLLPNVGRICETAAPPWQSAGGGHQIMCHIPVEQLRGLGPDVAARPPEG